MSTSMSNHGPMCTSGNTFGVSVPIARIDLTMVMRKIADPSEGLGFSEAQCASGELEYKRYLELCRKHGPGIVPNKIMDSVWHFHILDTRAYQTDCQSAFGGFLHHFPYFGMRGDDDARALVAAFERTKQLYEDAFGEPMARDEHTACWHDCENRCWHACAS